MVNRETKRRLFNRSLESVLAHYDNTFAFNPDRIKPEIIELPEDTLIGVSKEGLKRYWRDLDGIISRTDHN